MSLPGEQHDVDEEWALFRVVLQSVGALPAQREAELQVRDAFLGALRKHRSIVRVETTGEIHRAIRETLAETRAEASSHAG